MPLFYQLCQQQIKRQQFLEILTMILIKTAIRRFKINDLLFLFSTQKTGQLLKSLRQESQKKRISHPQNHTTFMQILQGDTTLVQNQSPFLHYTSVRRLFQEYLTEAVTNPNFQQYDPKKISSQGQRLSQMAGKISRYPRFQLQKQHIRSAYKIFCRFLNEKNDEQLSEMLLFTLKIDDQAEQSVIYNQFLRYYLEEKWEVLKAKFQFDLGKESLGNFIKKIAASVVHRGFLRRTPDFGRFLRVLYPSQVLSLILQNPSTSNSLMIRKLIYQQIFTPIAQFYEQTMHSNLYHLKNVELWQKLNENGAILFDENKYLQKECEHLRELYVTLFMVLRQQSKIQDIKKHLSVVGTAYQFVVRLYDSEKAIQFKKEVEQFMGSEFQNNIKPYLKLDQHIFKLVKKFPKFAPQVIEFIEEKIAPITFYTYFSQILDLLSNWSPKMLNKISKFQSQNIFDHIPPSLCLSLVQKLNASLHIPLYNTIISSIVDRDYKTEPSVSQIITILQIYSCYRCLGLKLEQNEKLKVLRVFLFRFIADNKEAINGKDLERVIDLVDGLSDEETFGDGNGNYQLNIFQELGAVIDRKFISSQSKQKIRSKLPSQTDSKGLNNIKELLKKLNQ